jgi:hypothetical protein
MSFGTSTSRGPFFINLTGRGYIKTWLVGLVDDHSRFVIGLQILPGAKASPILAWLDECFELCGQPLQLMSDNGQPFVVWMPGVLRKPGPLLVPVTPNESTRVRGCCGVGLRHAGALLPAFSYVCGNFN